VKYRAGEPHVRQITEDLRSGVDAGPCGSAAQVIGVSRAGAPAWSLPGLLPVISFTGRTEHQGELAASTNSPDAKARKALRRKLPTRLAQRTAAQTTLNALYRLWGHAEDIDGVPPRQREHKIRAGGPAAARPEGAAD